MSTSAHESIAVESTVGLHHMMLEMVTAMLSQGGQSIILDVGGNFRRACQALNGKFVAITEDAPIPLNPFRGINSQSIHYPCHFDDIADVTGPALFSLIEQASSIGYDDQDREFFKVMMRRMSYLHGRRSGPSVELLLEYLRINRHPVTNAWADVLDQYLPWTESDDRESYAPFTVLDFSGVSDNPVFQRALVTLAIADAWSHMYFKNEQQQKTLLLIADADLLPGAINHALLEGIVRASFKMHSGKCVISPPVGDFRRETAGFAPVVVENGNVRVAPYWAKANAAQVAS